MQIHHPHTYFFYFSLTSLSFPIIYIFTHICTPPKGFIEDLLALLIKQTFVLQVSLLISEAIQNRIYPIVSLNHITPWVPIFFRPRAVFIVQILISALPGSPFREINLLVNSQGYFFFFAAIRKLSTVTPVSPHFMLIRKNPTWFQLPILSIS